MALPPKDVSAPELFQKLLERPAPSDVIEMPRVGSVRVRVLRMDHHNKARALAKQRARTDYGLTNDELEHFADLIGDMVAQELIAFACLAPEPIGGTEDAPQYKRIFRHGGDVAAVLTADEVTVLFTVYNAVQRRYGPFEGNLESDEEVSAWISVLEEGAESSPLFAAALPRPGALIANLVRRGRALSSILESPPENLPTLLASIPANWVIGTFSSSELPAGFTPYGDDVTWQESAELAQAIFKQD